jgi:GNAT superfamily N-acetyltransferase
MTLTRPVPGDAASLNAWCDYVTTQESACHNLMAQLATRPNFHFSREQGREVGCIPYIVTVDFCYFATGQITGRHATVRVVLLDHNSASDVVITNMTVLPKEARSHGKGSMVVSQIIEWAGDLGMKEIRATQINNPQSENFWRKNHFTLAPEPNPCNDYVINPTFKCPDCGTWLYAHRLGVNVPCKKTRTA